MNWRKAGWAVSAGMSGLLALSMISGCGNEGESVAAAEQANVDPRFATADAIVEHYNSIVTKTPVDVEAMIEICYPETDTQRRAVDMLRSMTPMMKLDQLMLDRFGEGWAPGKKTPLAGIKPSKPVSITKRDGERVEAQEPRDPEKVYFVRFQDRWWLSGYTIEYNIPIEKLLPQEQGLLRVLKACSASAPAVISEIRSGTITSAHAARGAVVQRAMQNDPNLARDLQTLAPTRPR